MDDHFVVTATTLNVRSTPVIKEENKIAALSENQVVARREIVGDGSWWKISAVNNCQLINGYVASRFLASAPRHIRAIGWFKSQFGDKIRAAVSGAPFDLNLLTAIAMQETYYIWGNLYPLMSETEVLTLCTGDTIDSPSRSAFPKNKADLLSFAKGAEMFGIARTALENVAHHILRSRLLSSRRLASFVEVMVSFSLTFSSLRTILTTSLKRNGLTLMNAFLIVSMS